MEISWGTIKSLLFTFGPFLLPKAISYYRQARAAPRAAGLSIVPLPAAARRSIAILLCAALLFLVLSLPTFAPENVTAPPRSPSAPSAGPTNPAPTSGTRSPRCWRRTC
ncbi:hypothetical protein DL769_011234 [Monosporascus sp. CRB-8-3]|nr:hypothetical protein DL769_011234 [Monosporascus sp. CRB-8-3]